MSHLEQLMQAQLDQSDLPTPEQEYTFTDARRWRFDFAWPEYKVACEVEGGIWARGRHVRGDGFRKDCIKYNYAATLGWLVVRVTADMVNDNTALDWCRLALRRRGWDAN